MIRLLVLLFLCSYVHADFMQLKSRLSNFRDPFRKKILAAPGVKTGTGKKKIKTFFSNRINPLSISLEKLEIVGIFLGVERRAIGRRIDAGKGKAKSKGTNTFIIKEGMKIGPDRAEVKAILPAGIVLVEKIVNVYDEIEFLETVIPLTEQ